MTNKILIFTILLVSVFACKKAEVTRKSEVCNLTIADSSALHPKHQLFSSILKKYQEKGLPGVAVMIEDENGVWMGSAGKADLKAGTDFKPCTVAKVASITKMMFAAAVMQLREQGKVNLDDKISKWLDADIIKNVENADKATIRDLLQHSTGIFDIITDSDFYLAVLNQPNKKWTGEELIKFAYNKPKTMDYQVNATKGSYSNTNTLLLSMCIESITGVGHHEYMRQLVINKVGMNNTYYQSHEELPSQTAQGYYDLYNNGTIVNVSNLVTGSGNGYGGIYSNVIDLHKFIRALFIEKTLVNQASLDIMTTFISDDDFSELGVGLLRQGYGIHKGVGHSGRDLGYSGGAHYYPTKNNRIFINLVNYGTNGETKLRKVFYDMRDEFARELTNY
jgi:D-alanyl-D-alanine carboxypeptidase